MPDPEAIARLSGYSWDEIDAHTDQAQTAALAEGYTNNEIDHHLGFDPDTVQARAQDLYNTSALTNPLAISKIDARKTYAELLYGNEVRGAGSFALALGDAAMSGSGASGSHLEEVTTQMGELAAGLPSRRELIDAGLELSTGEDFDTVRENLISHWYETGQRPGVAARMAGQDGELYDKLTAAPRGVAGEFYQAAMRGAGDIFSGLAHLGGTLSKTLGLNSPQSLVEHEAELKRVMDDFMAEHAPSRNDWTGWGANLLGEGGLQLGAVAVAGIPAAIIYGTTHGADAAWRETKDLGAAAMGAGVGALEMGLPVAVLRTPAGKSLIARAVGDAIKLGAIGGLSRTLDPLPEWVAGRGYNTPSLEDVGMAAFGGAVIGGVAGAGSHALMRGLERAANPRTSMMMEDGTVETVNVPKPNDLVVAGRTPDGTIYYGQPGQLHPDIIMKVPNGIPEPDIEMGFAKPGGDFLTRKEALASLGAEHPVAEKPYAKESGELDAADYREAMKIPPKAFSIDEAKHAEAIDLASKPAREEVPATPTTEGVEAEPPLASGYRAAAAFKSMFDPFIPDWFRKIMKDEAGTLDLSKIPRGNDKWQTVADNNLRVASNTRDIYKQSIESRMEPFRKVMEPAFRVYEALRKNGDKQGMYDSEIGRFKRIMGGDHGVDFEADHPFIPALAEARELTKLAEAWIQHGTSTSGRFINFIKEYFPHMWKDNDAPDSFYGSPLHARSLESWGEGILGGKEDRFPHPLDALVFNTANSVGWGIRMQLEKTLTDLGLIRWDASTKPGGKNVLIRGMTKRAPSEELDTHAEEAGKVELIRGTQTLYAHTDPEIGRLLNNWSDNFRNIPTDRPWVETIGRILNVLKSITLIGPLYHTWTIGQAAWATGLSVLASDAARLNARTAGSLWRAVTAPAYLAAQGARLKAEMMEMGKLTPEGLDRWLTLDPELAMVVRGGSRPGSRQDAYRPSEATGVIRALWRGSYGRELAEQFDSKPWYSMPGIAVSEFARAVTSVSAPLFDYAIPNMKSGAVIEQVRAYLRQNPTATQAERMIAARKIVDNVDDRMGELNLNNVFWPRWGRNIASTMMISMSWVYGSVRQVAAGALFTRLRSGGGGPVIEVNPTAMLNLASTFMVSAGVNAIYQYIKTGQLPGEEPNFGDSPPWAIAKDLLAPRSGGYTKSGQAARILLPGEQKEVYDWIKIVAETNARYNAPHGGLGQAMITATSGLAHYAEGKMPGYMRIMQTLATGSDPIGHEVASTPQGLSGYLLEALMPLMVTSVSKTRPRSNISWEEAAVGIREMPSWVSEPIRFNAIQRNLVERSWMDELRRHYHEQAALRP